MAKLSRFSRVLRRSPRMATLMTISLALVTLVSLCIFFLPVDLDDDDILAHRRSVILSSNRLWLRGAGWGQTLSWEPRISIYRNFLSGEECEYLIELARPHMKESLVINQMTGMGQESRARTSTGTYFKRGEDQVVQAIEKRIADFTFVPVENGEQLQIIHYEVGQKYDAHYDYFVDNVNTKYGGQRIATVLMYLSDVEEGGETVFPSAKINVTHNKISKCGEKGLSIKPKMGDALLFWNLKPDGNPDPLSLHGGCPVIEGDKWISTKWLREREYTYIKPSAALKV